MATLSTSNLETIGPTGTPPKTRISDPAKMQEIVLSLDKENQKRSQTAATVFGLFNGNTPFNSETMRKNGQSWRSNFSDRVGEAFLNQGITPFWDTVSGSETGSTVRLDASKLGDQAEMVDDWSGIITEEFDRLNKADSGMNYMWQLSQFWMVLHGIGPVFYEDTTDYRSKPLLRPMSNLLVPQGTKSNVDDWSICAVINDYAPHELYQWISNPSAASAAGWDVKAVREAMMNAAPSSMWPNSRQSDWEIYEQMIRSNDMHMSTVSEVIKVAHVFFREFGGGITHCIISMGGLPAKSFLFQKIERFNRWQEVIHPFYYDNGDGTHHGVKGLGVKSYSLLYTQNRLKCHTVDAAVLGTAMHFHSTGSTADDANVLALGPVIIHPESRAFIAQVNLGQQLDGAMYVQHDLLTTLTSNLAQYRQDLQRTKGNPLTAREVDYRAENQNIIGRAQLTRYYEQLDDFYTERYRRASNPKLDKINPGGEEALEFQRRCVVRGVPKEVLGKVEWVRATRAVGWGSADARRQSLTRLAGIIPMLSESGRANLIEDLVAAEVGYTSMRKYVPEGAQMAEVEHASEAQQNVATMKVGLQPITSPRANPAIYAQVYLQAASEAVGSLEQGGNPEEVYSFLQVAGPAIRQQLDKLAQDPTRQEQSQQFEQVYQRIVGMADRLEQQLTSVQQAQEQATTKQQVTMSAEQLAQWKAEQENRRKDQKAMQDEKRKEAKARQQARVKETQARQSMALRDATTAQNITTGSAKAKVDMEIKKQKAQQSNESIDPS